MCFPGKLRSLAWAVLCVLVAGCAAKSDYVGRSHLSGALQQRSGQALRGDSAPTNQLPLEVELTDGVTADEAVATALWNNAAFQENLSKLGLARGDLAEASLLSNPNFSILFPLGPKQLEFAATFPLEAVWLRPRRVAIAKLDAERVAGGLIQNGLDLIRDVRVGLSDLELARDRVRLNVEAVALQERIEKITQDRERAGEGSALETSAAQAELARAHDDTPRIGHDVIVARERLLFLLGWNSEGTKLNFESNSAPAALSLPLTELEARALAARPDLRACELAVESAAKRAGLAKAEIFTLSGIIDANGSGSEGFEIGPGAQLAIPIFNQNQAGRARANAGLERAVWNCIGMQQRIRLEVREAYTRHQQAAEALDNWRNRLVPSLQELLRRAERAYALGDLPPLTLQDYARQLVTARVREAELAAVMRRAWAELERRVGTRLQIEDK
jgi:cobalt-zinc-cadmium efflux system outer membrane protein